MKEDTQYLLVEASVLPEVFIRVMQAKLFLARGKAKNASQAARMADISRSAFYKYKDSVFLYDERMNERTAHFYLTLEDRPGVLSAMLAEFHRSGANIVTVNQNIPVDGVATVSVSVRLPEEAGCTRPELLEMLGALEGVVDARSI